MKRRRARVLLAFGCVASLVAATCGDSNDEVSNGAGSMTAYCAGLAGIVQQSQEAGEFDPETASDAEIEDYFGRLRDGYAALALTAPAAIRPDVETLRKALDDLVRELDRLGYSYPALLTDPEGRRVFDAMASGPTSDAAERINRFGDENCAGGSGEYGVTVTGPTRPSGAPGALPPGTEVLRLTAKSGEVTRVVETAGSSSTGQLCVFRGAGSWCFAIPPAGLPIRGPQSFGAPPNTGVYAFLLPSGFPRDLLVRDVTGGVLQSALSSNGHLLLVLDIDDPALASAGSSRSFDLVRADGSLLSRVTSSNQSSPPSTGSTGSPSTGSTGSSSLADATALAACLRAQGLDVPDPSSGGTSAGRQYPAEDARRAWNACGAAYVSRITTDPRAMKYFDCMADRGWIAAITAPQASSSSYLADNQACNAASRS